MNFFVVVNYCKYTGYYTNYTWNGTLQPLQEYDVVLPEPWDLRVVSGDAANHNFMAQILQVNGQTDEDTTNNLMTTVFKPAPWLVPSFTYTFPDGTPYTFSPLTLAQIGQPTILLSTVQHYVPR